MRLAAAGACSQAHATAHPAGVGDLELLQGLLQWAQSLSQVGLVGRGHDGCRPSQPMDGAGAHDALGLVLLQAGAVEAASGMQTSRWQEQLLIRDWGQGTWPLPGQG